MSLDTSLNGFIFEQYIPCQKLCKQCHKKTKNVSKLKALQAPDDFVVVSDHDADVDFIPPAKNLLSASTSDVDSQEQRKELSEP